MKQHDLHSSTARKHDWYTITASREGRSDEEITTKLLKKEEKKNYSKKKKKVSNISLEVSSPN